jgi:hypothetical protein
MDGKLAVTANGLDHHSAHPVIPAGCRNPVPWMASLSIGSKFDILALGPGILPGRRLDGIMIKAPPTFSVLASILPPRSIG